MLVISRKSQEFLQIGDNIIVKVIKTASGSVKIGIDAPGGVRVLRGELAEMSDSTPSPVAATRHWRDALRPAREADVLAAVEVV